MVQAIIKLGEHEDRVLNVIKAKHGLKNKSDAINFILSKYEEELLEPELRPEFVKKMMTRQQEPTTKINDFRKHFGIK
ncbi:DUF2683 family protein [Candidatus Woesearchaeota archaeon]|nr:DUF2683 family protein [Candidatus Woesearchaeota archaeon]